MAVRIQFRRGTAAEWTSANPTLVAGELGYETDTTKFKIGDGSTAWTSLGYGGVSQADIDNAVANVIDLAPGALDTLNELAASIGDDADFANTVANNINSAIDTHNDDTTDVHGITNTLALETQAGAQNKANAAQTAAQSYADNAIANLIDSSPAALDTLNELAAALGDDANFSTTVTNNLANKISFVVDTSANFQAANALTTANVFYLESDAPTYLRVGDGISNYNDLLSVGSDYVDLSLYAHTSENTNVHGIANTADLLVTQDLTDHASLTENIHGIADTSLLATDSDVSTAVSDHNALTTNVHGINNTAELVINSDLAAYAPAANATLSGTVSLPATTSIGDVSADEISYLDGVTSGIQGQLDLLAPLSTPTFTGTVTLPGDTVIGNVSAVEIGSLEGVTSAIQTQIDAKEDSVTAAATYAPLSNATLSGTVSLPTTTSIGDVDSTEIEHLNGVTSAIQTQIDGKLGTSTAASTYAPLANATLSGTVSLPATTSIGEVSATEISYLNNVSSAIQTQIDAKAPIESPTFTGTVSGVTASMVGLGSVDNTADADKPISTATQTALDAKLALAGGTMTGKITLDGDPTQSLHAVTKQYADSISEGLHIHASVVALSDSNIDLTGSTPTTVIDGVTLADGDRVMINGQTDSAENGLYVFAAAGSVFSRADDFDEPGEAAGGDFVFVLGGTNYENTGWVKTSDTVATIGTDPINFTQFSGAGSVTGGTNIEVTGTQVAVVADPTFTDATITNLDVTNATFADGTVQTSAGVPSVTGFTEKTASYTLDTLDHQDNVIEMNSGSATTFTIPTNSALAWPVGASMDIIQTGAGQVTISPDTGVTLNFTPGNKLRTQWSSCTIMKRGTDSWIVYGDLTA